MDKQQCKIHEHVDKQQCKIHEHAWLRSGWSHLKAMLHDRFELVPAEAPVLQAAAAKAFAEPCDKDFTKSEEVKEA